MPDLVTSIAERAFKCCRSLKFIQFPPNLEFIWDKACRNCEALEAVYLPPTVNHIAGDRAFCECKSLRYFNLPDTIEHISDRVVFVWNRLLTTVRYKRDADGNYNNAEVNQWLIQRHANLPLHQACSSSTSVNSQGIEVYIQEQGIEHA